MKRGFTLAEVLITLGVIGVVAAMTMPILIQQHKKHVIETKLKQNISILQQAITRSIVDNDSPETWGIKDGQKDTFEVYIKPYLKILKTCDINVNNKDDICNNCVFDYNNRGDCQAKYIMNNGSSVMYRFGGTGLVNSKRRGKFFIVPNNKKEKLILGRNVFSFNFIVQDNKTYRITSATDYAGNFCSLNKSLLYDYCLNGTGDRGYTNGIMCSAIIECNNWKIPDDYPIRF